MKPAGFDWCGFSQCREPGQLGVLGVSVSQPVDLNLKDLVRESARPSTLIIRKSEIWKEGGLK